MKTLNGKVAQCSLVLNFEFSESEVRQVLAAEVPKDAFYSLLQSKTPAKQDYEGDHNFNEFKNGIGQMLVQQMANECRQLPETTEVTA